MSVVDKINVARKHMVGDGVAVAITKATSHLIEAPKKKHVDYLLMCLQADNVDVTNLGGLLIQRLIDKNVVVRLKTLVVLHTLMNQGSEKFLWYFATQANCFGNAGSVQGGLRSVVEPYESYLKKRLEGYIHYSIDYCRQREGFSLQTTDNNKLFGITEELQELLTVLMKFEKEIRQIGDPAVKSGILAGTIVHLYRDSLRIYSSYSQAIINMIERFFSMQKKDCQRALAIYRTFLGLTTSFSEWNRRASESLGLGSGDTMELTRAPSSLLGALESHYAGLDRGGAPTGLQVPQSSPGKGTTRNISQVQIEKLIEEERSAYELLKKQSFSCSMTVPTTSHQGDAVLGGSHSAVPSSVSKQNPASIVSRPNSASPDMTPASSNMSNTDLLLLNDTFSTTSGTVPKLSNPFQGTNTTSSEPANPFHQFNGGSGPSAFRVTPEAHFDAFADFTNGGVSSGPSSSSKQSFDPFSGQTGIIQAPSLSGPSPFDTMPSLMDQIIVTSENSPVLKTNGNTSSLSLLGTGSFDLKADSARANQQWRPSAPAQRTGGSNFQMNSSNLTMMPSQPATAPSLWTQSTPMPGTTPALYPSPFVPGATGMQPSAGSALFSTPQQPVYSMHPAMYPAQPGLGGFFRPVTSQALQPSHMFPPQMQQPRF